MGKILAATLEIELCLYCSGAVPASRVVNKAYRVIEPLGGVGKKPTL